MLLSRRNTGTANLHRFLVGIAALALWILLSHSGIRFTTLLPEFSYPLAILLGAMLVTTDFRLPSDSESGAQFRVSHLEALRLALRQTAFICGTIFSVVVLFKDPGLSRFFLFNYIACLIPLLTILNRYQPRLIARLFHTTGQPVTTLVVGNPAAFPRLDNWLEHSRRLGVIPFGHVTYRADDGLIPSVPPLGTFADIGRLLKEHRVMQVVMLEPPSDSRDAETLLRLCMANGTRLLIHNHFGYKLGYPFQTVQDEQHSFLALQDEPLEDPLNRAVKRGLDILVAGFVLVTVFAPLAAIVALVQRRQSPGPLFHSQLRTGHNRTRFRIYKFRTMHAKQEDLVRQATSNDDRIYAFGRFLRRSSLDEIPQFINVLRGEMSTVGPRPHLLAHSDAFSRDLDIYLLRYFTKPGITGLAQCNGFRGNTSSPDQLRGRVQLDLEYIRNWSIWMDLWIMLKTSRQVFFPPRTAI